MPGASAASGRAWALKQSAEGGHDRTSGRILFVRTVILWLQGQSADHPIGQLHTLLAQGDLPCHGNINPQWDPGDVLGVLQSDLSPERHEFLTALVEALNDQSKVDTLETFSAWREARPVSLDQDG